MNMTSSTNRYILKDGVGKASCNACALTVAIIEKVSFPRLTARFPLAQE